MRGKVFSFRMFSVNTKLLRVYLRHETYSTLSLGHTFNVAGERKQQGDEIVSDFHHIRLN